MPTLLELLGVAHEHPGWAADGISLMPLIKQLATTPNANDTSLRATDHPLVFKLDDQVKIINNQWVRRWVRSPIECVCLRMASARTSATLRVRQLTGFSCLTIRADYDVTPPTMTSHHRL